MQYRNLILAAAVLTAGAGTAALASPERGPRGPGFADTNGDGVVTVEELQNKSAERFQKADADGNGKLDVEEMQAAMLRERAERRVRALDTDGDGEVSAEEFQAPMRWHLSRMDRNDDGRLEPNEMRRHHDRRWDDDHGRRHEGGRYDD